MLHGKKIFSKVSELPTLKIPFDEVIITAPSASGQQMRKIVTSCKETGKRYRTVPGLNELMDQKVTVSSIRDVSYADLLGREEVKLDMNSIDNMISGKRVLITGAGGSIGSELVRQTLKYKPSELICLDHSEEKIFNMSQELDKIDSLITIKTVLASINNIKEIEKVFLDNRPEIVFHAAAYKHVPIQEIHPWTAVRTNIGGTLNLVNCADKHKSTKFILVSTDKAVNPVNVMGATKRVAERIIQSINQESKTSFMAVRFGNVLGSSGSAIPTFQKQINKGGPLTITHPEMTRYFMSIQEASQLILQCGSIGKEGEIFLLEMGKPIKILQMAKDLIRLSGFEPDIDIPIVFTGLRPGEKLYEELQLFNEKKVVTSHKKIMVLKSSISLMKWILLSTEIKKLIQNSEELDAESIRRMLKKLSPDYQPNLIIETKKRNIATDFESFKAEA
jgi:FlaA1/EpsC-like NDP-sugar epimerase